MKHTRFTRFVPRRFLSAARLEGFTLTRLWLIAAFSFCGFSAFAQQKVVRLYDGPAPGSETWTHTEKEARSERGSVRGHNVVNPTLTVFPADPVD